MVQAQAILFRKVVQGHQALQPNALRNNAISLRSLTRRSANAFVTCLREILIAMIKASLISTTRNALANAFKN
jgi:hypothetical protein